MRTAAAESLAATNTRHAPDAHVSLLLGLHVPRLHLLLLLMATISTKPLLLGCTTTLLLVLHLLLLLLLQHPVFYLSKHINHAPDAHVSLLLGLTAAART
jgi:hypothetical protein